MHFLYTTLITLWIWEFIKVYLSRLPDWCIHFLLIPFIACLAMIIPSPVSVVLSVAGAVMLLQSLGSGTSHTQTPRTKKRTNMPPPP